jgi:Domain of unknown function (DUF892)
LLIHTSFWVWLVDAQAPIIKAQHHPTGGHVHFQVAPAERATGPDKEPRLQGEFMRESRLGHLYVEELKDLYNAENQLLKALPKMASASTSEELRWL